MTVFFRFPSASEDATVSAVTCEQQRARYGGKLKHLPANFYLIHKQHVDVWIHPVWLRCYCTAL